MPLTNVLNRLGAHVASRVRQGGRRVSASAIPVLQAAIAAALAWTIAAYLIGRPNPIFAPVAAWICLGYRRDRVPRKVAEMGVGALLGVILGDLAMNVTGINVVSIVVLVTVGGLLGRFLDDGELFSIQIGVNALAVVAFTGLPGQDVVRNRWIDAFTGAAVAFVFAVLLPRRPTARGRRYVRSLYNELAVLIELVGGAIASGDVARIMAARGQRDAVSKLLGHTDEVLTATREITRRNPALRSYRPEVAELQRLLRLSRRTLRTVDMLMRQAAGMTEEVGSVGLAAPILAQLGAATHGIANAVPTMRRPDGARRILTEVAGELAPSDVESEDWRPVALMSLLRALAVDLLQASGLSKVDARAHLPDTWGRPFAKARVDGAQDGEDRSSHLWG